MMLTSWGTRPKQNRAWVRALMREKKRALVTEIQGYQELGDRLAELLNGVAAALKGAPPKNMAHDWSQLPKVARRYAKLCPAERRRIMAKIRRENAAALKEFNRRG